MWKFGKTDGDGTKIWKDGRKYLGNFKESLFSYIRAQEMIVKKANHSEIRTLEDGSKALVADPHQTYLKLDYQDYKRLKET